MPMQTAKDFDHVPSPERPATCAVLVLLPVYNGERFLAEQIESVLNQVEVKSFLMCRDDGSSDASATLLRDLQARWSDRIRVLEDGDGNLGASGNFSRLMHAALDFKLPATWSDLPCYVALSDQDDLWHPDKLATCVAAIRALEREHPGAPALIHSDLRVIAEDGREIAASMARYQGLQTQRSGFAAQLLSNTLTGCTSLMNRELLEKGLPIHPEAIMHDWWLSLVASALGHRCYLDQALIDYRQHASNAIGAKAQDKPVVFKSILHRLFDDRHGDIFRLNARQARAFLDQYRSQLSRRQRFVSWLASHLALPIPPAQRLLYRVLRQM